MPKRLLVASIFTLIFVGNSLASMPEELAKEHIAFKVKGVWYSIPPGHFVYENTDPEMTFGEAMKVLGRLDFQMEQETGTKLALSSDQRDRPHGIQFLLMLDPCNDYKVKMPPLLSQVLDASKRLADCKPRVVKGPSEAKKQKIKPDRK